MIAPERLSSALYALQGVLIRARLLAHDPTKAKDVAKLLDYAEHLPRLMASGPDETKQFRDVLAEVAKLYQCAFILERFDNPVPSAW